MEEQSEKPICADGAQKTSSDVSQNRPRQKGLNIEPPPKESGDEPLYRVVYVIDVNSADVQEAAQYTHRIMTDPESLPPVLHVIDYKGNDTVVDLSAEPTCHEVMHQPGNLDEQASRFVKSGATICPKCGSENLSFRSIDIEDQSAYQRASCQDCESRFYSIYRLVGFGLYNGDDVDIHTLTEGEIKETPVLSKVYKAIEQILESLDVGGEQSRQFADEIKILRDAINHPK